jgi:hypothetical protein
MYLFRLLFLFIIFCFFTSGKKSNSEIDKILFSLTNYLSEWHYCYNNKFNNDNMIRLLEASDKSASPDNKFDLYADVNGIKIKFVSGVGILNKFNKKKAKIKPACGKNPDGSIVLSYPLLSHNKKESVVLVHTDCGDGCGSGELFILKLSDAGWAVSERIIKYSNKPKPALPK